MVELNEAVTFKISDNEYIELTKNSKGYNWSIKLLGVVDQKQLDKLKMLNENMLGTYCAGV